MIFNNILTTKKSKQIRIDIKDIYLVMKKWSSMTILNINYFPEKILYEYISRKYLDKYKMLQQELRKGMSSLPQVKDIENKALIKSMMKYGYYFVE